MSWLAMVRSIRFSMENVMACRPEVAGRDAGDPDAYTIRQFCTKHGLSVAFYYKLKAQGLTPAEIHLGTRRLISKESAATWRRERENSATT
jgi:hypothetical protein